MRIVAITGGFAAGKTTLARNLAPRLTRETGQEWHVMSIAAEIKRRAGQLFDTEITPENKAIFRPLLQVMADVNQALGEPTRWIQILRNTAYSEYIFRYALDDVRFCYELDYLYQSIAAVGFLYQINLDVPLEARIARYKALYGTEPTPEQIIHPSETDLLLPDGSIYAPAGNAARTITIPGAMSADWVLDIASEWLLAGITLDSVREAAAV